MVCAGTREDTFTKLLAGIYGALNEQGSNNTYVHTVRVCERIEGYFGREASKDHRTTELVMLQLDCGCI